MSVEEPATALGDAIEAALPGWVVRVVARAYSGAAGPGLTGSVPPEVMALAQAAGEQAALDVVPLIRTLLRADIDDQATTPLAILRALATPYPTSVLLEAGVDPAERDRFVAVAFPDDIYDLGPVSLADLDPSLAGAGIAWGAAKAFEHKRRHQ